LFGSELTGSQNLAFFGLCTCALHSIV